MGIEPTSSAWKAEVLPLNYTRIVADSLQPARCRGFNCLPNTGLVIPIVLALIRGPVCRTRGPLPSTGNWWRGEDSNLRRHSQQIYSLPPLAAWVPLPKKRKPHIFI